MSRTVKDMEKDKFVDGNTRTPSVRVTKSSRQTDLDNADFRLMISYQAKILEELEKLNTYMQIITGEDL